MTVYTRIKSRRVEGVGVPRRRKAIDDFDPELHLKRSTADGIAGPTLHRVPRAVPGADHTDQVETIEGKALNLRGHQLDMLDRVATNPTTIKLQVFNRMVHLENFLKNPANQNAANCQTLRVRQKFTLQLDQ